MRPSSINTQHKPAGSLRVHVLGPLDVVDVRQGRVQVTTGRLRTLLALLAVSAGQVVSVDRCAEALWGDALPGHPRRSVQTYMTRLRALVGTAAIETTAGGYLLRVDPDHVDALRFESLLDAAEHETEPESRRSALGMALELWRGSPFEGVGSDVLVNVEAPRLVERYLTAVEQRAAADLDLGRHGEVVAQMREFTARHPLRESFWVLMLTALERSGRRAEALEQYERIRRRLADDLGVDPVPRLQEIYAGLLAHPAPDAHRTTTDRRHETWHHLDRNTQAATASGDRRAKARALRSLGTALAEQGRYEESLDRNFEALALFKSAGQRAGEAAALDAVGWCHQQLGRYYEALAYWHQALALYRELDDRFAQAVTSERLAHVHAQLGEADRAVARFELAAVLAEPITDPEVTAPVA